MAKRKKTGVVQGSSEELAHNPFGALSGMRAPEAPAAQAAQAAEQAEAEVDAKPEPAPRFAKKLVVRREKKGRRGKTVTCITGIPKGEIESVAKEMKKALGCGASVEGDQLVLQGSLVDRAAAWLEKQGANQIVKGN